MVNSLSAGEHGNDTLHPSPHPNSSPTRENSKEHVFIADDSGILREAQLQKSTTLPSEQRQTLFMVFITLTQLVQMIPLGAGINSSLAIGKVLGATRLESAWIVASYPLTQGSFVLIGKFVSSNTHTSKNKDLRLTALF